MVKLFKLKIPSLALIIFLCAVFIFSGSAFAAVDAQDLCKDKQRASVCEKAVEKDLKKCKGKTGSAKTKCEAKAKKHAKKFKDKTGNSASSASTGLGNGKGGANYQCGSGEDAVKTKFDFGCLGDNYSQGDIGPIQDLAFSIIRFLSAGVGLLVVASIIYAGIQYSSSQGSPEATSEAKGRIQNSVIGLVIYMFIFALVQYLVPGGVFASSIFLDGPMIGFK